MKFTPLVKPFGSIVRLQLRTNTIFFFLVFVSLQSLISSVRLIPNEKVIGIWSHQDHVISCSKDDNRTGGIVRWYAYRQPIGESHQSPLYAKQDRDSAKLVMNKVSKKIFWIIRVQTRNGRKGGFS